MNKRNIWAAIGGCLLVIVCCWVFYDQNLGAPLEKITTVESSSPGSPELSVNALLQSEGNHEESVSEQKRVPSDEHANKVLLNGQVLNQFGHGIEGMSVELSLETNPGVKKTIIETTTDSSGEFGFDDLVLNASYRLEVLASGGYKGKLLDSLSVSEDMSNLKILLDTITLSSANGMMVDVDGTPIINFETLVQNEGMAYPARKVISDSSGFFELDQFPAGSIQMSTQGDDHFQITGITLVENDRRHLTLVFDKGQYHLSGWVSDQSNQPIPQARVVLTSVIDGQFYLSSSYRLAITDRNGGFKFSNIGGQQHQITADATGYNTLVLAHQFRFASDSINIRLDNIVD